MGWLVGYTLAAMVVAFIAIRIFDHVFASLVGGANSVLRACVFVVAWTAIVAKAGMHGFTSKVRQLRQMLSHRVSG